mmetsp:Transcript_77957/g.246287  ORF Transcript_77957/g.246287 Transcript_77957/m.246287 type:complete len:371 (+) Transcript_77957:605-1717(+)
MGRRCTGAWEERDDTCEVLHKMRCDETLASSDALCQCGPQTGSATAPPATTTAPPTTTPTAATPHTTASATTAEPRSADATRGRGAHAEVAAQLQERRRNGQAHRASQQDGSLVPGDRVEVRDAAVSQWLPATVTSLDPLLARPDGWTASYRWDESRSAARMLDAGSELLEQPSPSCLCIFDIDRTLTCKQRQAWHCDGAREIPGVEDTAYGGGPLALSDLARGLPRTFCGACLRGIVTAGVASGEGSDERSVLLETLGGINWTLSDRWSPPAPNVHSLLVVGAPDTKKQHSVRGMVDWLRKSKGVDIRPSDVHFFDDNDLNVPPFKDTGFNARQISCGSRDGIVGLCGGLAEEVVSDRGVRPCPRSRGR